MNTGISHKATTVPLHPTEDMDGVLHSFLGWLEQQYNEKAQNAYTSKSLLGLGLKTQFASEWETFLSNPIDSMYATRKAIDTSLVNVINMMVATYLKSRIDLIAKAVWAETKNNTLHYCIFLKEDSLENRIIVNDFFDFYDEYALSETYPVYFQFISEKHFPIIKYKQEIV